MQSRAMAVHCCSMLQHSAAGQSQDLHTSILRLQWTGPVAYLQAGRSCVDLTTHRKLSSRSAAGAQVAEMYQCAVLAHWALRKAQSMCSWARAGHLTRQLITCSVKPHSQVESSTEEERHKHEKVRVAGTAWHLTCLPYVMPSHASGL